MKEPNRVSKSIDSEFYLSQISDFDIPIFDSAGLGEMSSSAVNEKLSETQRDGQGK